MRPKFVDIHSGVTGGKERWIFQSENAFPCHLMFAAFCLFAFVGLGHYGDYGNSLGHDVIDEFYVQGLGRNPGIKECDDSKKIFVVLYVFCYEFAPLIALRF